MMIVPPSILQYDSLTSEPYISLPSPHNNIRITPPRLSDAPASTVMMNDPLIYPFLNSPPFPYVLQNAEDFITHCLKETDRIYADIRAQLDDPLATALVASGCPVRSIREVKEDGTDIYIGDIGIMRNPYFEVSDPEEKAKCREENDAKPVGDPSIVWCFGDSLASSHHGRGIMTSAIKTIIQGWAVPYLNAHRIIATAYIDNVGSLRTFEKNGFAFKETVEIAGDQTHKGRTDMTITVLEWRKPQ